MAPQRLRHWEGESPALEFDLLGERVLVLEAVNLRRTNVFLSEMKVACLRRQRRPHLRLFAGLSSFRGRRGRDEAGILDWPSSSSVASARIRQEDEDEEDQDEEEEEDGRDC